MTGPLPRPVAETRSTVTLRKRDWKALIAFLEDIEDRAATAAVLAHEDTVGKKVARRDYLTGDELRCILDDESPVKVWREKRGLTQRELAEQAAVSPSYLAEIETGKKPGSTAALRKLARVLALPMENLLSHPGQDSVGHRRYSALRAVLGCRRVPSQQTCDGIPQLWVMLIEQLSS
jgi:transcriptional regulator with XRE-family HTH domain